eukprot:1432953-Prymnesium_polylepis.2
MCRIHSLFRPAMGGCGQLNENIQMLRQPSSLRGFRFGFAVLARWFGSNRRLLLLLLVIVELTILREALHGDFARGRRLLHALVSRIVLARQGSLHIRRDGRDVWLGVRYEQLQLHDCVKIILGECVFIEQLEDLRNPVGAADAERPKQCLTECGHVRLPHLLLAARNLRLHVRRALAQQPLTLRGG